MNKETYIHIKQVNGRDCWINPRHIIRVNAKTNEETIELLLTNSQIVDINSSDPENQQLMNYLDLNRKKVL